MAALARQALDLVFIAPSIFLTVCVSPIIFINSFRKMRRKGCSWPIAILVTAAGIILGLAGAGLVGYLLSRVLLSESLLALLASSVIIAANVSFVAFVAGIAALLPNRRVRISGERTGWKGDQKVAYGVAAFYFAAIAILLLYRPNLHDWGGLILAWSIFLGVSALIAGGTLAKRAAAARYVNSSQTSESHVLYLREFECERRPFIFSLRRHSALLNFFFGRIPLTLEQYLSSALESGLAPLVALGRPDDYLPPSGAARAYVVDQVWQERFEDLAVRSEAILLAPGSSESLRWELSFLLTKCLATRLFLVFGPLTFSQPGGDTEWLRKVTGIVAYEPLNWPRFIAATRAAGYNIAARPPVPPAVIAFDRKGNGVELRGTFQTPEEYVLAIKARLSQAAITAP